MRRLGDLESKPDQAAAAAICRPDLYVGAARAGLGGPRMRHEDRGQPRSSGLLPGLPSPILMGIGRFCEGARFYPAAVLSAR